MPTCRRCMGKKRVLFRYGVPGQDMHAPMKDIVWDGEGTEQICPVCRGRGTEAPPRHPDRIGTYRYDGVRWRKQ